ncbi:hypothetical protein KXF01_003708 [Escherichia coli]|nr:hypothetical protein [Escherichia coli]
MKNKITIDNLRWDFAKFIFGFCTFLFILPSLCNNTPVSEVWYFGRGIGMILLIFANTVNGSIFLGKLLIYLEQKKQ